MKKKIVFWLPRILGLIMILLVTFLALDAFDSSKNEPFYVQILAFLIHLIPSYILIIALLIARKWHRVGGLLYFGCGTFYLYMISDNFDLSAALFLSGPLFLTGFLFLIQPAKKPEVDQ